MDDATHHSDDPRTGRFRLSNMVGWIAARPLALGIVAGCAVFAAAAAGIQMVHARADDSIRLSVRKALTGYAAAAASAVDPELHARIRTAADHFTPDYRRAIAPIDALRRNLHDVAFIYTFRGTGPNDIVFGLDPEVLAPDGKTVAVESTPPGTPYTTPDPAMLEVIRTGSPTVAIEAAQDAWGSFVTAYSPVRHRDGSIECYVGVDMTAETYMGFESSVHLAAGLALAFCAVLSTGVGIGAAQWRTRFMERSVAERRMQVRLRRITENVPGGVFVYEEGRDQVGRIGFASDGFHDLCGTCPTRPPTKNAVTLMFYPDDRVHAVSALVHCRREMSVWRGEYRSVDGTRWIEVRAQPMRMPDGSVHWYGFAADFTERKRAEVALREAKAHAERASRVKSEFVANTSHELRTPLAAIVGYAELLREDGNLPADRHESQEAVDGIARNAEHMLGVIGDIVDGEQIAAGRLHVTSVAMDAAAVACDVTGLLQVRASQKGLVLRFDRAECNEAFVSADPMRVRQILLNLAGNAIKFTERGEVVISIEPAEHSVAIAVRDTGPGMDAEQVSRLFERFSQTSPEHAAVGSGLGLAISRQLARLIGGNITVSSTPGTGTTFRLHLLRVGAPGTAEGTPKLDVGLTGNSLRPLDGLQVLLAEDGADNVRLIRHHLDRAGAVVTVVGDGKAAASTVRAAHLGVLERPFDLVLMDLDLPGMDGLAATRDLRASGIDVPIVALTAQSAADDRVRALDAGCNDFASKPVGRTELLMLALRWGAAGRAGNAPRAAACPVPQIA